MKKIRMNRVCISSLCMLFAGSLQGSSALADPGKESNLEKLLRKHKNEAIKIENQLKQNYEKFSSILPEVKEVVKNPSSKSVLKKSVKEIVSHESTRNQLAEDPLAREYLHTPNSDKTLEKIAQSGDGRKVLLQEAKKDVDDAQIRFESQKSQLAQKQLQISDEEIQAALKIEKWYKRNQATAFRQRIPEELMTPRMKKLCQSPDPKIKSLMMGLSGRKAMIELAEEYRSLQKAQANLAKIERLPLPKPRKWVETTSEVAGLMKNEMALSARLRELNFTAAEIETIAKGKTVFGKMKSILKIAPAMALLLGITAEALGEDEVPEGAATAGEVRTKSNSVESSSERNSPSNIHSAE